MTLSPGPGSPAPDQLETRIGAHSLLAPVLADLGHDPAPVFRAAGLATDALDDPEGQVAVAALGRFIAAAVAVSGRRDLGLLVARRAGSSFVGTLLQWLADSRTLREALDRLARLVPYNTRTATARLVTGTDRAAFELTADFPLDEVAAVTEDGVVAITVASLRALLGDGWRPLAVEFAHAPTAPPATYRQLLGTRVAFSCLRSAIIIDAADLDRRLVAPPLPPAFPAPRRPAHTRLEEQVRAAIRSRLADPDLDRAHIARAIGMSSRSLNRRLAERGLSFAALLRDTRYRVARQLLADSAAQLGDIALALGYPEQSAFSRAFRQWSGTCPRDWRRLNHPGAGIG